MKLSDALHPTRIVHLQARTKSQALQELLTVAAASLGLPQTEDLMQRVLDREAICTTAVSRGVAIPHARSTQIDNVVATLGISRSGLDFNSPDGEPVHLVFLILSSEIATPSYLSVLGRTARIFHRDDMRQDILEIDDPGAIIQAIANQEPA